MANVLYGPAKTALLGGGGSPIDFLNDDIRALLIDTDDYTFSAAHDFLDDVAAGARVGTPVALTGKTVGSVADGVADCNDITYGGPIGEEANAVLFYKHTGVDGTSQLLLWKDTGIGGVPVASGANVNMTIDANGLFRLIDGVGASSVLFDPAKTKLLDRSIDLLTDDIRLQLIDTDEYTFTQSHEFLSSVPAGARVGTAQALSSKTVGSVGDGVFDAADVSYGVIPEEANAGLLYLHTGSDATASLIGWIDESDVGGLPAAGGADVTITWNANGIIRLVDA